MIEDVNQDALDGLRQFIADRPTWGITEMQETYYCLMQHPDLFYVRSDQGVLAALVNEVWHGRNGWKT